MDRSGYHATNDIPSKTEFESIIQGVPRDLPGELVSNTHLDLQPFSFTHTPLHLHIQTYVTVSRAKHNSILSIRLGSLPKCLHTLSNTLSYRKVIMGIAPSLRVELAMLPTGLIRQPPTRNHGVRHTWRKSAGRIWEAVRAALIMM